LKQYYDTQKGVNSTPSKVNSHLVASDLVIQSSDGGTAHKNEKRDAGDKFEDGGVGGYDEEYTAFISNDNECSNYSEEEDGEEDREASDEDGNEVKNNVK